MIFYNFGIWLLHIGVAIAALFHKKTRLFRDGRKGVLNKIEDHFSKHPGEYAWIHCASLGEFELAAPLIEQIKQNTPLQVLITFFSPSGYEIKKNYEHADAVFYLPLDFKKNADRFVHIVKPKLAIFSKYDFWIHYIDALHQAHIPTFVISAHFHSKQLYFKPYAGFYRRALQKFDHFFVIDKNSAQRLQQIQITQVSVVGDNRFDKVVKTVQTPYINDVVEEFKEGERLLLVGSAWPQDIDVIKNLINQKTFWWKVIIAPHDISEKNIDHIYKSLKKDIVRYSQADQKCLHCHQILLIDNIGLLSRLYRYAEIAYVGGAFKQGLHNVLEPIAYGLPVITGPDIAKFPEALEAQKLGGLFNIHNAATFESTFQNVTTPERLKHIHQTNTSFAHNNLGATDKIYDALKQKGLLNL